MKLHSVAVPSGLTNIELAFKDEAGDVVCCGPPLVNGEWPATAVAGLKDGRAVIVRREDARPCGIAWAAPVRFIIKG